MSWFHFTVTRCVVLDSSRCIKLEELSQYLTVTRANNFTCDSANFSVAPVARILATGDKLSLACQGTHLPDVELA
jgi:hypothetical protein